MAGTKKRLEQSCDLDVFWVLRGAVPARVQEVKHKALGAC